ncbi:MAG TPA: hemolysin family protein [Rugosimonospora sp.]|nr:hemolysin family protein [Rugosimonospora sp.]
MGNLLITALLLLGNAFFVAGEFALIASRRTVVEPQAASGSARARLALRAMGQVPLMIAGAQLGVTVCSLGLGAIAEPALAHLLVVPFHAVGLPGGAAHPVAFVLALVLVVFAHTVLGEMVPKNLTLVGPERAVLWLGPLMLWFCVATKPLLVTMRWLSQHILLLWRIEPAEAVKTVYTAEELAGLVAESRTEGLLDQEEHARITGALALHERTAADALRPWSAVTTVTEDVSPAALEVLANRTGRSRFPVVERETRRVLGFIHIKDVIGFDDERRRVPVPSDVVRPMPVIPPDRTLAEALLAMRRERRHIVLVSDGRVPLGVLALDDVLRAVVGGRDRQVQSVAR